MYSNLIDCIAQSLPLFDYFLYVGIMLIISISLIVVRSNWILVFMFAAVGVLAILDIPAPNFLSGAIFFFIVSIRLANNIIYSTCIYFLTFMIVIGSHVVNAKSPLDAVNVIIGYAVIYLIEHLMYNNKEGYIL